PAPARFPCGSRASSRQPRPARSRRRQGQLRSGNQSRSGRYVKNPDTGKRVARINPAEAWITTDVPQLRIVDDALWVLPISRRRAAPATWNTHGPRLNKRRKVCLVPSLQEGYSMKKTI